MAYFNQIEWDTNNAQTALVFDCTAYDIGGVQVTMTLYPTASVTVGVEVSLDRNNWYPAPGAGGTTAATLTVNNVTTSMLYQSYQLTPFRYMRVTLPATTGSVGKVLVTVVADTSRGHPASYHAMEDTWLFTGTASDAKLSSLAKVVGDVGAIQATPVGAFTVSDFALIEGSIDGIGWYGVRLVSDKTAGGSGVSITYNGSPIILSGLNLQLLKYWRARNTGVSGTGTLNLTFSSFNSPKGADLENAYAL